MATYIHGGLEVRSEAKREAILLKICKAFPALFGKDNVLLALWGRDLVRPYVLGREHQEAIRGEFGIWCKLAAAIAAGAYDLVRDLLPRIPSPVSRKISQGPLSDAIITQDLQMVNIVLTYLRALELHKAANRKLKKQYITLPSSAFYPKSNVSISIEQPHAKGSITQALVDFYQELDPTPTQEAYRVWLDVCIEHRNLTALSIVTRMPHYFQLTGMKTIFRNACLTGVGEYVGILLDNLDIELNHGTVATLPLFQAVLTGSVPAVEAVLERSSLALDMRVKSNFKAKSVKGKEMSALEMAIYAKDVAMVKCLVDHASPVPPRKQWPKHAEIRHILREAVLKNTRIQSKLDKSDGKDAEIQSVVHKTGAKDSARNSRCVIM